MSRCCRTHRNLSSQRDSDLTPGPGSSFSSSGVCTAVADHAKSIHEPVLARASTYCVSLCSSAMSPWRRRGCCHRCAPPQRTDGVLRDGGVMVHLAGEQHAPDHWADRARQGRRCPLCGARLALGPAGPVKRPHLTFKRYANVRQPPWKPFVRGLDLRDLGLLPRA